MARIRNRDREVFGENFTEDHDVFRRIIDNENRFPCARRPTSLETIHDSPPLLFLLLPG